MADTDHKTLTDICAFVTREFGSVGVNGRNDLLQTPLHIASCLGDHDLVQVLLDFGADIALVDRNIETAIHLAVKYENQSCLKALLSSVAKSGRGGRFGNVLDALNANGLSALHLCLNCKVESAQNMIRMIVESGADISEALIHVFEQN